MISTTSLLTPSLKLTVGARYTPSLSGPILVSCCRRSATSESARAWCTVGNGLPRSAAQCPAHFIEHHRAHLASAFTPHRLTEPVFSQWMALATSPAVPGAMAKAGNSSLMARSISTPWSFTPPSPSSWASSLRR